MDGNNYLEHHGILGQRWGIRRYQNKDGSLTKLGSRRLGYSTEDKAKAKEEKRAAAIDKKRNKILTKGSKEDLYKNRNLFTNEEIVQRVNRLNLEESLGKQAGLIKEKGKGIINKLGSLANGVGRIVDTGLKFRDTAKKLAGLPVIGDSIKNNPELKKFAQNFGIIDKDKRIFKSLKEALDNIDSVDMKEAQDIANWASNVTRAKTNRNIAYDKDTEWGKKMSEESRKSEAQKKVNEEYQYSRSHENTYSYVYKKAGENISSSVFDIIGNSKIPNGAYESGKEITDTIYYLEDKSNNESTDKKK